MATYLDGTDDVFDSRDVIERIQELTDEIGDNSAPDDFVMERDELSALTALVEELGETEARDGITLIRDDYFPDYAEEFVTECGYIPADMPSWLANNIDWDAVADELKVDYTSYELFGETYWGRY